MPFKQQQVLYQPKIRLVGQNQCIITFISTCHQVCICPTNKTGITTYHQQESLLRQKNVKKAKPRKSFHHGDLNEYVCLCNTCEESIILVGDFNEPVNEWSSMALIASTHRLLDILFQQNAHMPEPHMYAWGSPIWIDYALIMPDLVKAVKWCRYKPFQKRVKLDHSGMFIDFATNMLFGNETQKMGSPASRDFTSKNLANNWKYIASAEHAHLTTNKTCFTIYPVSKLFAIVTMLLPNA